MFKLGLSVKVRSSSLVQACDKPKLLFEVELMGKLKSLGLLGLA